MRNDRIALAIIASVVAASAILAAESLEFGDFSGMDMRGKVPTGSDLGLAKLTGANLRGVDFTGLRLSRTELRGADLSWTRNWAAAALVDEIDAREADFRQADLRGASVTGTYFEQADFRHADLRGAWLSGRFHGARFDEAEVEGAVMLGAVGGLDDGLVADLAKRGALVDAATFTAALKAGMSAEGRSAAGFQLESADLEGVSFAGGSLHSARVVALAPLAVVVLFAFTGSSPIAQFNGSLGVWSWWVGAFFPAIGVLSVAALAFLMVVPMWILRGRREPGQPLPLVLAAASLTGLALLAALPCTLMLAPRA
jgi:uncharacterized protein YjbI with pentapeptide repeats